jgi:predicted nucleotidyltransferase
MLDPIPADVREEALRRLRQIEREEGVRVLYACESGSRAWGFASPDSDFDVRFLYLHPPAWYLAIDRRRDVIERPIVDDLDVSGWDLRKALGLMRKSNPVLGEWLGSPIVYLDREPALTDRLRAAWADHFAPVSGGHHYLNMARRTHKTYLQGEEVVRKKYFYALRPLLAVRWIEQGRGPVPTPFAPLVDAVLPDGPVQAELAALLDAKRAGAETDAGPHLPALDAFIESGLDRLGPLLQSWPKADADPAVLSGLFRSSLATCWPDADPLDPASDAERGPTRTA